MIWRRMKNRVTKKKKCTEDTQENKNKPNGFLLTKSDNLYQT